MQTNELHFVLQKVIGLMRIKGKFFPKWKDLELYPCGLRQNSYGKAYQDSHKELEKIKKCYKGSYRIIKRYIQIPENNLQLKLIERV